MEFFHGLRRHLKAVGTCLCMTAGTSTVSTNRTARACRCMVTGRTTSTTKGDKKHVSSYTVHPVPPHPSTDQNLPESDRRLFWVSMCTKRPSRDLTQAGRVPGGAPYCRLLLSVPEVRVIVGHDLYPEVTNDLMSLISPGCGRADVPGQVFTDLAGDLRTFFRCGKSAKEPLEKASSRDTADPRIRLKIV